MSSKTKDIAYFIVIIALIIGINYVSSLSFIRQDLTSDKIHSLSPKSIHFLENQLVDDISVDIYLDGDFPAEIQKLQNRLTEKLNEFKAYAGNKLRIRYINPNEDPELKEDFKKEIYAEGIDPAYIMITKDATQQEGIEIWPGMLLKQGDKTVAVQLLQGGTLPIRQEIINRFTDQLEFKFIQGLIKLTTDNVKTISFLRGHGELNNADIYDIRHKIMEFYSVDTVRIRQLRNEYFNSSIDSAEVQWNQIIKTNFPYVVIDSDTVYIYDDNGNLIEGIDNNLKRYFQAIQLNRFKQNPLNFSESLTALNKSDGLIIAKPKQPFSEKEKFIIDQYIMNGGKVFWLLDRVDVKEYLLKDSAYVYSEPIASDLEDFITTYGARVNSDLITDYQCAPVKRVDGRGNLIKWYFYPVLKTLNPNEFNLNVAPIRLKYASSVDSFGTAKIKKTPILQTSTKFLKKRQFRVTYKDLTASNPEMFDSPENKSPLTMGLLLEGNFTSNYKNRGINKTFKRFLDQSNFKESCDTANAMVVFGDADFIRNDLVINKETGQYQPIFLEFEAADLGTPEFAPVYGNSVFFLNIIDKLMGNDVLIPLRSRMKIPRLLSIDQITIQKKYWQFINLFIPSFLIVLLGVSIWLLKRKKYN